MVLGKKQSTLLFAISLCCGAALASDLTIPNTFSSGATTSASQMNANFTAVESAVDDNHSRILVLEAMVNPVFQGFSSTSFDGSAGTRSMKSACNSSFSGSKICTTKEFLNSTYNASASNLSGSAWLLPELQAYGTNNSTVIDTWTGISDTTSYPEREMTCQGWVSSNSSYRGMTVTSIGSFGRTTCDTSLPVACCK